MQATQRHSSDSDLTKLNFVPKPEPKSCALTSCWAPKGAGSSYKNTGTVALTVFALSLLSATAFLVTRHFKPTMAKPLTIGAGVSGAVAATSLLFASCCCGFGKYKAAQSGNYAMYMDS